MIPNKLKLLIAICTLSCSNLFSQATATYTGKPMFQILVKRAGIPIGTIKVELFPLIAPHHVRNFDSLVSTLFYDTTAFHRVIPGFMIQGGDPNSRHGAVSTWGYGQPGQPTVNAEFSVAKHLRGILSAARSTNINSATSQFFICVAPAPSLDGNYSIYGRVASGMNIVDTIVLAPRNAQDRPNLKHEMFVTYIGSNDSIPKATTLLSPPKDSVGVDSSSYLLLKWKAPIDGIIYHLEVSTDSTFATTDLSVDVGNPAMYFNNMAGNTRYYWRVKTNNGGHIGPYSKTWNFHTAGQTTGLKSQIADQKNISVFPNPGNGTFTFSGLTPGSLLKIVDTSGKLIYETTAKQNEMLVNFNDKDHGIYLYNIVLSGKEIASGKLINR